MKTIICLFLIFCIAFTCWAIQQTKVQDIPVIILPEDYEAISKDQLHPDLLKAHYTGDTIFLEFSIL